MLESLPVAVGLEPGIHPGLDTHTHTLICWGPAPINIMFMSLDFEEQDVEDFFGEHANSACSLHAHLCEPHYFALFAKSKIEVRCWK